MQTIKAYDNYERARRAACELEAAGIPSSEISLLANRYVNTGYADRDETSKTVTGAGLGSDVARNASMEFEPSGIIFASP